MVEDFHGRYKPLYKEFPNAKRSKSTYPTINFNAPAGFCPFFPPHFFDEKKTQKAKSSRDTDQRRRQKERDTFNALSPADKIRFARKRGPKTGYCECCKVEFNDPNKVPFSLFACYFIGSSLISFCIASMLLPSSTRNLPMTTPIM